MPRATSASSRMRECGTPAVEREILAIMAAFSVPIFS
jgi:hypothetical protein